MLAAIWHLAQNNHCTKEVCIEGALAELPLSSAAKSLYFFLCSEREGSHWPDERREAESAKPQPCGGGLGNGEEESGSDINCTLPEGVKIKPFMTLQCL